MLLPGLHHAQRSRLLQRLEDLNLCTLGAIASVPLVHLRAAIGPAAGLLHDWALGIDSSPVRPPIAQPVIERSVRLDPDEVDDRHLLSRLYELLEHLCMTLRQQRRVCRQLSLVVRHSDHVERAAHETLAYSTYWESDLKPALTRLFVRCFRRRVRLARMTLQVAQLGAPAEQLSLFDEPESIISRRSHRLALALDTIRSKFGTYAIAWGKTLP
jgi:DNA polymerase-4